MGGRLMLLARVSGFDSGQRTIAGRSSRPPCIPKGTPAKAPRSPPRASGCHRPSSLRGVSRTGAGGALAGSGSRPRAGPWLSRHSRRAASAGAGSGAWCSRAWYPGARRGGGGTRAALDEDRERAAHAALLRALRSARVSLGACVASGGERVTVGDPSRSTGGAVAARTCASARASFLSGSPGPLVCEICS